MANSKELLLPASKFKTPSLPRSAGAMTLIVAAAAISGCNSSKTFAGLTPGETLTQGYVIDQQSIDLVPVGSSREQVLLALGSPSTTATFDSEVFYYISQTRRRPVAFMNAEACRPAHPRRLFQRRRPRRQHRQLRDEGRQGVRLHLAHDADRRHATRTSSARCFLAPATWALRAASNYLGGGSSKPRVTAALSLANKKPAGSLPRVFV